MLPVESQPTFSEQYIASTFPEHDTSLKAGDKQTAPCFQAYVLLGLLHDPEDETSPDWQQTTRCHSPFPNHCW
jgi:hypothetical protein